MQSILREKLLAHALKLSVVSDTYRKDSSRFVELYYSWLDETEKDISSLRSPISIILQSEKSSLTSVLDGYLPDNIQPGTSVRKHLRAFAAQSLEKVSKEIYSKIDSIDTQLDQMNEQLCHAIAILAIKAPGLYDNLETNQMCIDAIWKMLSSLPETMQMYNYFCAKLTLTDRNYILIDIIQKIMSNRILTPVT